jgi:thiamine kinase-like enzyme
LNDFKDLLSKHVGANKKIISTDITNLVELGENFGGELLKLAITVEDEATKKTELLHAVAKKIPELEYFQKVFNIQETFKSEITFYEKLVPIFRQFQEQHNVAEVLDCVAEIYGSRWNLNGSDVVDKDAVLILENLIIPGYKNLDRYIGFNLEEAKLVLKELAGLHAVPLGIKMKHPDHFEKDIRPHLNEKIPHQSDFRDMILFLSDILFESDKCVSAVTKVQNAWKRIYDTSNLYVPREPFATFSHCDVWINNIMIKHDDEGKPLKIKFVDFQIYNYKSPAVDVLNFLFTSVQTDVLKDDIDNLIKYYHGELISNLKQLDCSTEPFGFYELQKELKKDAHVVMCWALIFIPLVIFGPKGQGPNIQKGEFDNQ